MKYLALVSILFLSACDNMGSNTNHVTDSTAGVQLIPHNSTDQNMPIDTTDTSATANIPTVDPDTSNVQPK